MKIILSKPWTFRTPQQTTHYEAGEYEVTDEVAKAAPKQKVKNGKSSKSAKADTPRITDTGEG